MRLFAISLLAAVPACLAHPKPLNPDRLSAQCNCPSEFIYRDGQIGDVTENQISDDVTFLANLDKQKFINDLTVRNALREKFGETSIEKKLTKRGLLEDAKLGIFCSNACCCVTLMMAGLSTGLGAAASVASTAIYNALTAADLPISLENAAALGAVAGVTYYAVSLASVASTYYTPILAAALTSKGQPNAATIVSRLGVISVLGISTLAGFTAGRVGSLVVEGANPVIAGRAGAIAGVMSIFPSNGFSLLGREELQRIVWTVGVYTSIGTALAAYIKVDLGTGALMGCATGGIYGCIMSADFSPKFDKQSDALPRK